MDALFRYDDRRSHRESRSRVTDTQPEAKNVSPPAVSVSASAADDFVIHITAAMMADRLTEIINMPTSPTGPQVCSPPGLKRYCLID